MCQKNQKWKDYKDKIGMNKCNRKKEGKKPTRPKMMARSKGPKVLPLSQVPLFIFIPTSQLRVSERFP